MRNLKRALSLALAAIMVLGMMVIGAGAASLDDFSDKDEIVNDEAVLVLNTLGVIKGKDNGTYDPKGTVTRGEMAKMICVILNGGKDPNLGEALNYSYTDTKSHWAAPYIEYCTTKGIVSGRGDGRFDPDGTVSLAEAAKMLLVALGYNASVQGYVGLDWQIKTDVQANALKLYDGVDAANTNVALTRDNAAQMCYNALDKHMVVYDYVITGNAQNAITTQPQINDTKKGTLLWEMFGAVKVVGEVTANGFANLSSTKKDTDLAPAGTVVGNALDADKTQILVTNNGDGQSVYKNQSYTFTIATGEEVLGKAVYMFVKPASDSTNSLKATVIGSAIVSSDNKIVADASGDTVKDVADDNNLDLTADTQYVYNYNSLGEDDFAAKNGMTGIQKTIVDTDSDGKIDYVLYREMLLGKVTLYSETKDGQIVVAVNNGNYITKDKDDVSGFENVAKDDYVLTAFFGGKLHVQKAETVTGVINAYRQADKGVNRNTDFTIDSENYKVSRVLTYTGDITAAVDTVDKTILSSEATFYLDENGYVIAYGEVDESAYKYAFVWGADAGTRINDDRVKVTLENGTTKTYDLSTNSDIDVIEDADGPSTPATTGNKASITEADMVGMVFSYTLTSGGDIKLYLTKGGAVTGDTPDFTKGLTTVRLSHPSIIDDADLMSPAGKNAGTTGSYYSNNATTFFYVETLPNGEVDKVSVYNGRNNAPSVDASRQTGAPNVTLALNSKGDVGSAVFFDVRVSESAGDHMFVYATKYVSEDYVTVDAFMNGATEATEDVKAALYLNNEVVHNPDVDKGIYLFKLDSSGNYELTAPSMRTQTYYFEGTVDRVNKANSTFVIKRSDNNSTEEFRVDSKSVVVDYDSNHSDPVAVANGSVSVGDVVQVIVNNADDHSVLMAVIMERVDPTTGNGNGGVSLTWDGKTQPAGTTRVYPNGTATTETAIDDAFKTGDVFIAGNYSLSRNLTIPEGRKLYVTGDLIETVGPPSCVVTNYGSLYVGGDAAISYGVSLSAKSVAEIAGNLNANGTAIAGTVKVGQELTGAGALNVAAGAKLYAGVVNIGGNTLDVYGHVQVSGYTVSGNYIPGDVTAGIINVHSANSLILNGALNCATLNVATSATETGKVEAMSINATTINLRNGSVTTTNGTLAATTLNLTPDAGKTAALTTNGSATVVNPISVPANATLSVGGALEAKGGLTVNNGSLDADSLKVDAGNALTVIGNANVDVPKTEGVNVDTSAATGNNVNVGTSSDSTVALNGAIKTSNTYEGKVEIKAGETTMAKNTTLTFKGEVSGLANLSGTDKTSKVIFGANVKITGETNNFVDKDNKAMTADELVGKTFTYDSAKKVFVYAGASTGTEPEKPGVVSRVDFKAFELKLNEKLANPEITTAGVKGEYTWTNAKVGDTIKAGNYTLTVKLTLDAGYTFGETVTGTLGGKTATMDKTASTLTFTFEVKDEGGVTPDVPGDLPPAAVVEKAISLPFYGKEPSAADALAKINSDIKDLTFDSVSPDVKNAYIGATPYEITLVKYVKVTIDGADAGFAKASDGVMVGKQTVGASYLVDVKVGKAANVKTVAAEGVLTLGTLTKDTNLYTAIEIAVGTGVTIGNIKAGTGFDATALSGDIKYVAVGEPMQITANASTDKLWNQMTMNGENFHAAVLANSTAAQVETYTVDAKDAVEGKITFGQIQGVKLVIDGHEQTGIFKVNGETEIESSALQGSYVAVTEEGATAAEAVEITNAMNDAGTGIVGKITVPENTTGTLTLASAVKVTGPSTGLATAKYSFGDLKDKDVTVGTTAVYIARGAVLTLTASDNGAKHITVAVDGGAAETIGTPGVADTSKATATYPIPETGEAFVFALADNTP